MLLSDVDARCMCCERGEIHLAGKCIHTSLKS